MSSDFSYIRQSAAKCATRLVTELYKPTVAGMVAVKPNLDSAAYLFQFAEFIDGHRGGDPGRMTPVSSIVNHPIRCLNLAIDTIAGAHAAGVPMGFSPDDVIARASGYINWINNRIVPEVAGAARDITAKRKLGM